MKNYVCYVCDKEKLTRDEIGLTKKLIDEKSKRFFCIDCLANYLEVNSEVLIEKIEDFKIQGCVHF